MDSLLIEPVLCNASAEPEGLEHISSILKRMGLSCEAQMTATFDPALSLRLDALEVLRQRLHEERPA